MNKEKMSGKNLSEELRNFELQPSPGVWERIAATDTAPVKDTRTLRYLLMGAAAAVLLTGLLILWHVNRHDVSADPEDIMQVAANVPHDDGSPAHTSDLPSPTSNLTDASIAKEKPSTENADETETIKETSPALNASTVAPFKTQPVTTRHEKPAVTSVTVKQDNKPVSEPGQVTPPEVKHAITTADQKENTASDHHSDQKTTKLEVFIPSAFTPDNDGVNDYFLPVIQNNAEVKEYRMQVYARNGTLLFESVNPENGWDGRFQGLLVEDVVCVYVISFRDGEGNPYLRRGTVTIIK